MAPPPGPAAWLHLMLVHLRTVIDARKPTAGAAAPVLALLWLRLQHLRQQFLQPRVLGLQLPQPLRVQHAHAAEFRLPGIIGERRKGSVQEVEQQAVQAFRRIMLNPVACIEVDERSAFTKLRAALSQCGGPVLVPFTPYDQSQRCEATKFGVTPIPRQQGAVPVDHRGHRPRLRPSGAICFDVCFGKSACPRGAQQRRSERREIPMRQQDFGQPRKTKQADIAAPFSLLSIMAHRSHPNGRMRRGDGNEFFQTVGITRGEPPADSCPPVMPDQEDSSFIQSVRQTEDITRQYVDVIRRDAGRPVTQVVATLVRRNHAIAGRGESPELMSPAVPVFRKPMQQHDGAAILWAGLCDVQRDSIGLASPEAQVGGKFKRAQSLSSLLDLGYR